MTFDYKELLRQQLYTLQNQLTLTDVTFIVDSEQAFLKNKNLKENTIYVLTRDLQNDNSFGIDTQPIQVLILTENNQLDVSKAFFTEFAKKYNFHPISQPYSENNVSHNIWVKQQYSDPVVLSNFNTVAYGYRSVLYMAVNLYIMYDVVDLKDLKIDNNKLEVLTWDLSYNMSPNTQQAGSEYIASTKKAISTLAITITIPVVSSALITKVLGILNETDTTTTDQTDSLSLGGNENFYFDFYLGAIHFENKKMKLVLADFASAVDNVPAIKLGFQK